MKQALVVDNNEFYRKVVKDLLREEGYEVVVAADGIEALRRAAEKRPDLVILDLVMPRLDGMKACQQIRSDPRYEGIAIVVLSGILLEDMGNLERIGADAYLAKMPLDRLLPALRTMVRRLEEGCDEILVDGFEGLYRREVVVELLEEKRFRDLLFAALGEGVVQLDAERRVVSVNPAFAALVGQGELEVIDLPIDEILHLDGPESGQLFRPTENGAASQHIVTLGEKTLRLKASPIHREDKELAYLLLVEDVSQAVRSEQEREALQRQLTQTEKLSALGQMVAGTAHELNNPLTGVLGYAQLSLQHCGDDEPLAQNLRKVLEQAKRCQKIIDQLLAFSRRAVPVRGSEDLNTLLGAALEGMGEELREEGVEVVLDLDPDLPALPVDRAQWTQVFVQLVRNARRAMLCGPRPGRLRVATRVRDDRAVMEVEDNGVGIPYDVLPRIFDPFFTTADVGNGSGLGLSVAYGIVREHQGRIVVDGRPGEGARFTVELPLEQGEPAAAEPPGGTGRRGANPRVLVVDDEPVILELLVDLLEARGAQVDTADNGVKALEKLRGGDYDAVVLDLKMPEMGGREVYERLGDANPEMLSRVVFSTGDVVSSEAREFFRNVSAPVIQKPFQIDQVLRTLASYLEGGDAA